jgi:hypothetical protein
MRSYLVAGHNPPNDAAPARSDANQTRSTTNEASWPTKPSRDRI